MLLLLACAPPPLDLAVAPTHAEHAVGEPAASFVGPLGELACDTDPARALRRGEAGWRVLAVAEERVQLPDGTVETTTDDTPALDALVKRWAEADAAYTTRCGHAPETHVLVAADAGAPLASVVAVLVHLDAPLATRFLVAGEVHAPVPKPRGKRRELLVLPILDHSPAGWRRLSSLGDVEPRDVPDLEAAARQLADEHEEMAVVVALPGDPMSTVLAGADALTGVGIQVALAMNVDDVAHARAPTPAGHVRVALGDTVPVLALAPMPDLPERPLERDAPEEKVSRPSPAR